MSSGFFEERRSNNCYPCRQFQLCKKTNGAEALTMASGGLFKYPSAKADGNKYLKNNEGLYFSSSIIKSSMYYPINTSIYRGATKLQTKFKTVSTVYVSKDCYNCCRFQVCKKQMG